MTECNCGDVVDDASKPAADNLPFDIDLFDYCAALWKPNTDYALNVFARARAFGFGLQIQTPGTSGPKEPAWRGPLGTIIPDGSLKWVVVAAGANAINPATNQSATVDSVEAGALTVSELEIVEGRRLRGIYDACDPGVYVVTFGFTVAGVDRAFEQTVTVT